jgi:hypothetical protein
MEKPENDSEHAKAFQATYERFVSEHGNLYENKQAPLDESDRKKVRGFYNGVFVFFSILIIVFFVMLYYNYPKTVRDFFYAGTLAVSGVGGFIWGFYARKKTLKKNIKTVVKGVITGKKVIHEGKADRYRIKLSNQEDADITPADFERYTYGDIVQVELLGTKWLRIAGAKVISLGKLPGMPEESKLVMRYDSNSVWAKAGRLIGKLLMRK